MKKFVDWIRNLSLIQQLFIIILVSITIFSMLVFGYLNVSIDNYAEEQLYSLMKRSQDEVIFAYESGIKNAEALNKRIPNNMEHIILSKGKQVTHYGTSYFNTTVVKEAKKLIDFEGEILVSTVKIDETLYYFYFQKFDKNMMIVTIADTGFSQLMRKSLLSGVVDILLIVMLLIFFILLFWVGSIIYPINQIKAYIDKIRKGQPAFMLVNRDDEIGLLANSVVAMQRELETQEKVKMEMLHNISHDFKTPIATIKSYAESIKDGVYPYDTLEKSVDVIYDNANRLEKKVQSLLLLNRFSYILDESSDIHEISMQDIINKTILGVKVIRPDMNIEVDLKEVFFMGNQESWRVVVENIFDNALRYAKSKITIILNEEDGLLIENDGPLLEESKINSFFKPYEKGETGQFGLGLSIVKRVCNVYGYEVTAFNQNDLVVFKIDLKNKPKKPVGKTPEKKRR